MEFYDWVVLGWLSLCFSQLANEVLMSTVWMREKILYNIKDSVYISHNIILCDISTLTVIVKPHRVVYVQLSLCIVYMYNMVYVVTIIMYSIYV